MIARSRERDFQAKEEGETNEVKLSKPSSSTSSRQWSAFRNPRIVRVSRSFGGKDRHSKVCTIRGLRDRRIRLSVPTAIQLYDLQDRLGLGQPSKVIDWLLDNTRDDIDKLPPLPIPQGFGQFHHQPMLFSHDYSSSATQSSLPTLFDANSTFMKDSRLFRSFGLNVNRGLDGEDPIAAAPTRSSSRYNWDVEASLKLKSKEIENSSGDREKGKWISKVNEGNQNQGVGNYISSGHGQGLSAQNLFPSSSNSSLSGNLLNNSMSAFNPYYHWDASNLSLSQYGSHGFLPQTDTSLINTNTTATVPLPSSLTLPSGSHLFFCPPPTLPSLFTSYPPYITAPMENESREINHFALLGSNPQNLSTNSRTMKPFSLNVNPGQFHSHNSNETHPDKQNNS